MLKDGILSSMIALSYLFLLTSCYSSTAIKGTPVNELSLTAAQRSLKKIQTEGMKKELAKMSEVRANQVFSETSGVAEYRIGIQDVLEINSYVGDTVKTTAVTVDSRGRISYSFIDDLEVAGLTPTARAL